ncbi:unannotated protein [freshwater metagenome]|uniref:Unannotated protein n=1 Tax=freshwater metagenome TaxID=449393 RepID=A0A6J6BEA1_9ZZZZ
MLLTRRARSPVASLMRGRIVMSLTVTAGTVAPNLRYITTNVVELSTSRKLKAVIASEQGK